MIMRNKNNTDFFFNAIIRGAMEPLNLVTGEGLDAHLMRDYQAKSLFCKLFVFYGIR